MNYVSHQKPLPALTIYASSLAYFPRIVYINKIIENQNDGTEEKK